MSDRYMGVPVPDDLRDGWNGPVAAAWRRGVQAHRAVVQEAHRAAERGVTLVHHDSPDPGQLARLRALVNRRARTNRGDERR